MPPISLLCFRLNKLKLSQTTLDLPKKLNFLLLCQGWLQTPCPGKDQQSHSQAVSWPRAHKCVYEKAELQAASLSPQHHAAHRQGEELLCTSWSSLGISQHSPGQAVSPVRFVAGQEWQWLLTWQKAGAREMYTQGNRCTFTYKSKVTELETSLEDEVQWGQQALGCSLSGRSLLTRVASQRQMMLLQQLQHPRQQQQWMALALPSASSSCSCSSYEWQYPSELLSFHSNFVTVIC